MQTIYLFIFASSNWNKSSGRKELIRREVARTNSIFSGFLGRTDGHVCVVQHEQATWLTCYPAMEMPSLK